MEKEEDWLKTTISRSLQKNPGLRKEITFLAQWLAVKQPRDASFLTDQEKGELAKMLRVYAIEIEHAIERMGGRI